VANHLFDAAAQLFDNREYSANFNRINQSF